MPIRPVSPDPRSRAQSLPFQVRALLGAPLLCLLAACAPEESPAPAPDSDAAAPPAAAAPPPTPAPVQAGDATAAATNCTPDPGIDYLCGPRNAEDILRIGDSRWLLASGMNGQVSGGDFSGQLHLIDSETRTFSVVFPGEEPRLEQDMEGFAACPGPLDVEDFSAHGLALRAMEDGRLRLYMTSHGAREAIEVFNVETNGSMPSVAWVGCVLLPETAWSNSVAILSDGGFYATQFLPAGEALDPVLAGEITGHVFEWHPGGEVTVLEGSELSGPNGILFDEANNQLYVAAYGTEELVRFDLNSTPPAKETVPLEGMHPDNLRWTDAGTIFTAGGLTEACGQPACGWAVMEIDPQTLQASRVGGAGPEASLQGVSVAEKVGEEIWLGTYAGDRVGILDPVQAP